jgi:5'-3' exonuclease
MHTLVFDLSNLAYISAGFQIKHVEKHPHAAELIFQGSQQFMRDLYRQFAPDKVVFACDSDSYWRKEIFPEYKAQRPETPLKLAVRDAIAKFKAKNAHLCLELSGCEADDAIYGLTRHAPGKKTIVSSDGDFVQLVSEQVSVYDPRGRRFHKRMPNPDLGLFIKCMRGDVSDNIPSAYPRITEKRLIAAYHNDNIRELLFNTRHKDGRLVREAYEFNRQLIDLSLMPENLFLGLREHIHKLITIA